MALTVTATSYDLPNYVGELFFQKSQRPNNFLRLIGGLSGAVRTVKHWEFAMGVNYVLPAPTQPAILEGQDPTLREEDTNQVTNVLQIFQEGVGLTYTRESSTDSIGGLAIIPGGPNGDLQHPGSFDWQIARAIERIQTKMNLTFYQGAYQKPVDNTTARKTRGVRTAIVTNSYDCAAAALTKTLFEAKLQAMMDARMFNRGDELYALADSNGIAKLAGLYEGATLLPQSRTVVGVQVWTIITRWCTLNLVWEPDSTAGEIVVTQPAKIQPVAMPVVAGGMAKGLLFREELAHTGAARKEQMYGEWGIDYTDEIFHGVVKNYT